MHLSSAPRPTRLAPAIVAAALAALVATPAAAVIVLFTSGKEPTSLYAFDAPGTALVELKALESSIDVHSLAFCVDRDRPDNLLALGKQDGVLFQIELGTFDETVIGQLPAERAGHVVQMTCDFEGTLYLGDQTSEELLSLDVDTCQPTCAPVVVGRVETAPGAADVDLEGGDLEVDTAGNLYVITNQAGDNVFRIDKATAIATPQGELAVGGWATGGTWVGSSIAAALSTDDLLYWHNFATDAAGTFGPFTLAGQPLDVDFGDMARPLAYDPEISVELDAASYGPGDLVTFELSFRQYRFTPNQVRFVLFVSDGVGNPISQLVRVGPIEVPYLRRVGAGRSFTLPLTIPPGTYRLNVSVEGYPDGPFSDFAEFEVLPPV